MPKEACVLLNFGETIMVGPCSVCLWSPAVICFHAYNNRLQRSFIKVTCHFLSENRCCGQLRLACIRVTSSGRRVFLNHTGRTSRLCCVASNSVASVFLLKVDESSGLIQSSTHRKSLAVALLFTLVWSPPSFENIIFLVLPDCLKIWSSII